MPKKQNNQPGWSQKHSYFKKVDPTEIDKKLSANPDEYDRLVKNQGIPVRIYRSMFCPNVKNDKETHQVDCKICGGSGIIDVNPYESWAYFHSNSFYSQDNPEGRMDGNVIMVSFLSGIELQYLTLIELDIPDVFYERIKKQEGNLDILKYKALQVNALVDSSGRQYYEGNDFDLNQDGNIKWKVGKGPLKNTIYSIHYHSKIQFRTTKAIHKNRFLNVKRAADQVEIVKVNEAWECTKEYLVTRKDILDRLLDKNTIEDK
jgi:hypothetical protein